MAATAGDRAAAAAVKLAPRITMNTRRQFLITAPLTVLGAAVACGGNQQGPTGTAPAPTTPGAPPTFGAAPASGPPVSPSTFAEAEKLVQITMTPGQREMAAGSWQRSMAPLFERRVGPRKVALGPEVTPATRWNPLIGGAPQGPSRDSFVRSRGERIPLPAND